MNKKTQDVWYRQMAAPGVEYRWEVAAAVPKAYRLCIRSAHDHKMTTEYVVASVNDTPVTYYLAKAQHEFAEKIEKRILDARRQRNDSIDAREAAQRRALAERAVSESEGQGERQPVENNEVPANHDGEPAEEGTSGARRDTKGRGGRRQGKQKAGADTSAAVPQAGS